MLGDVTQKERQEQKVPTFRIHVTNTDTEAISDVDRQTPDEARTEALKSALQIGVDEVCKGKPFFGAEVRIKNGPDVLERLVVAIGVSPLR
jgi:hypothetical protein